MYGAGEYQLPVVRLNQATNISSPMCNKHNKHFHEHAICYGNKRMEQTNRT
jgi:hypothetical protein